MNQGRKHQQEARGAFLAAQQVALAVARRISGHTRAQQSRGGDEKLALVTPAEAAAKRRVFKATQHVAAQVAHFTHEDATTVVLISRSVQNAEEVCALAARWWRGDECHLCTDPRRCEEHVPHVMVYPACAGPGELVGWTYKTLKEAGLLVYFRECCGAC
jgi:hypothetical protein